MANATTLARVKDLIPVPQANVEYDALLNALIASVTREVEQFLGYEITQTERTQLYSVRVRDRYVFLRVVPVVSVAEVRVASLYDFASSTPLTADRDYHLSDAAAGMLIFEPGVLYEGEDTLQVRYTAGLGTTELNIEAAAPDLAHAAALQVGEEFRRRNTPSVQTTPGPRGSRTNVGSLRLLDRVKELLAPYQRTLILSSA
jgi:hypothetical protein